MALNTEQNQAPEIMTPETMAPPSSPKKWYKHKDIIAAGILAVLIFTISWAYFAISQPKQIKPTVVKNQDTLQQKNVLNDKQSASLENFSKSESFYYLIAEQSNVSYSTRQNGDIFDEIPTQLTLKKYDLKSSQVSVVGKELTDQHNFVGDPIPHAGTAVNSSSLVFANYGMYTITPEKVSINTPQNHNLEKPDTYYAEFAAPAISPDGKFVAYMDNDFANNTGHAP